MLYDFDKIIDRKNTNCIKHDTLVHSFGTDGLLPLWVADMDFETPDFIQNALYERMKHPVYAYAYFSDNFYISFINWMKKRHQLEIEHSSLKAIPGVLSGLAMGIEAFTEVGDRIIIQPPVYQPFFQLIESSDRVVVENKLLFENGVYKMNFDNLKACIDEKTKMIIISNPHNPVGRVWTKAELKELVAICEEYDILILTDEIHSDIVFEPNVYTPISSINEYARQNTLSFIAPSKTFNTAGFVTAMIIISNKEKRDAFCNLMSRFHLEGVNILGGVAFESAYTYGEEWLEQLLLYLKTNVEMVKFYLAEKLPSIKVTEPEGTYLLWLDFSALELNDEKLHEILMNEAGVALNKGLSFGEMGSNFMRLNIGSPQAIILDGLERMIAALKKYENI